MLKITLRPFRMFGYKPLFACCSPQAMSYGSSYTAPRYGYMQVSTANYARKTPSNYVGGNAYGAYSSYGHGARYGYGCVPHLRWLHVAITTPGVAALFINVLTLILVRGQQLIPTCMIHRIETGQRCSTVCTTILHP